jgi:hypothetical protein
LFRIGVLPKKYAGGSFLWMCFSEVAAVFGVFAGISAQPILLAGAHFLWIAFAPLPGGL